MSVNHSVNVILNLFQDLIRKNVILNLFQDLIKKKEDKVLIKDYYIYILTNTNNNVFYIGVTNNLERRVLEHKTGIIEGFTKKYKVHKLVYFEVCGNINDAIAREKQLKNWHREWKINLILRNNPNMKDLYDDMQ